MEGEFLYLQSVWVRTAQITIAHSHAVHFVPLEPEQAISTPTYDLFGTETTYNRKLELYVS